MRYCTARNTDMKELSVIKIKVRFDPSEWYSDFNTVSETDSFVRKNISFYFIFIFERRFSSYFLSGGGGNALDCCFPAAKYNRRRRRKLKK